jgi:hypothetical protein
MKNLDQEQLKELQSLDIWQKINTIATIVTGVASLIIALWAVTKG